MSDFYRLIAREQQEGQISATLLFNEKHELYAGHFPDNPITPGVVQLDIIKDILEKEMGWKVRLSELNRCKFLSPINPGLNHQYRFDLKYATSDEGEVRVQATLVDESNDTICLKTNAGFIKL